MASWLSQTLLMSTFLLMSSGVNSHTASVRISSICGRNEENCFNNCKTSVTINSHEIIPQKRGLLFHMVAIDTYDGSARNFSITFDGAIIPSPVLDNVRKFLSSIHANSLLVILTQGCAILPYELRDVIIKYYKNIEHYQDLERVNMFINCKGNCSVESAVITNNEYKFIKTIEVPLKVQRESTAMPMITKIKTQTSEYGGQLDGTIVLIASTTVGLFILLAGILLIALCCMKTSPNGKCSCGGQVLKIGEVDGLKNTVLTIHDSEYDNHTRDSF